ncbi:hypothetical protein [uncultured Corynebacterium sp.]|uniref:hypothetical protein n=1 Tax=uncultured Corynebacterium sp. TaxID=159447 RepID=UPI0025DB6A5A|nr:hypothetical protein [uncultured Corynebacterium sp.]
MDFMEIANNMSSYQANEWTAGTGLSPALIVPATIVISVVGILATVLLPSLITGSIGY